MANRRISRTKNFASYVNALNQDVSTLKNLDAGGSISARSISGDSLADTVTLFGNSIQSNNYAPGAAGWKIDGSGVAEFEDVYVRGDINAETGTIGYWNISPVDATRYIGPKKIFGTFLESADVGVNDNDKEDGVYVSLFKSYFEDALPINNARRVSNVATITVPGHTYEPGDYVQVIVNEDSTFNAYPFAALILETTAETFTYANTGADFPVADAVTGIIPTTQVTGTAQYYQDDVAGLFVRDYAKVKFDYGYFSSDGIKFADGETVNIVRNPSFETDANTISTTSWTLAGASDVASIAGASYPRVSKFPDMVSAWSFAGRSSAGAQYVWSGTGYDLATDYMLGTIDSAGAERFNLFDDNVDRTLYYNMDVFIHDSVEYIEVDTSTAPVISNTAVTLSVSPVYVPIESGSSTTTVATYVVAVPGTAPSYGNKVTISDMLPSSLNKTNATVSSSDGTTFTITGSGFTNVAASTQGGDFLGSSLSVGDIIYTGDLDVTGYDSSNNPTNYAVAPTGERYFAITALPTATSFSFTNLWESTPVTGDPIILDPEFLGSYYEVYRPMRGSTVSTVSIPADDFDNTTTATTIAATATTKTLNTSYTGSYLVNHRVQIYSAADPSEYVAGVVSAVSANTSITVKVDEVNATASFNDGVFSIYDITTGGYAFIDDYSQTTSTSSITIGTGSKTFATTHTGSYFVGFRVQVYSDADSSNYVEGIITSISSNTNIVVLVDTVGGSGVYTDWTFSHIGGTYLDITLTFNGGHQYVLGDSLYLDISTLGDDGFDYTDSYSGVGTFSIQVVSSNTTVRVTPWNYNPDTAISAASPVSFVNSSGFVRPAAAYSAPSDYTYNLDKLALEFSNGEVAYVGTLLTPSAAATWASDKYSSVYAYEYIYSLLSTTVGLSSIPLKPVQISSIKLIDAYKELDPDGWELKSNIEIRVPVGIDGLLASTGVFTPKWLSFVSTVIDNVGLTSGVEFFFGGDSAESSSWGDALNAPESYSVGSADVWIDVSVENKTSSLDHTSSIGFKSTTSNTLIAPANISALDSRYSARGLSFSDGDIGGWIDSKIIASSFGRTIKEHNTQDTSFADYSVVTLTSGEYLARGTLGNYKYSGSGLSSYTSDLIAGTEISAYKQTVSLSSGDVLVNKVASVGVWVDSTDTSYATTVADYTEFRSADGFKRTLTAGYVGSTSGALKKKRVVDPDAPDGFRAVSDSNSAPHILYRRGTSTCTTTSTTLGLGSVTLSGYFRTGASGKALVNFGGRVTNATSNVGTAISMRIRLGVNSKGEPVTNGAIQTMSVPEVESTGTTNRTDSGATIFFGDPHTTYYAEFLISTSTSGSTATAFDRHFTITPIV